MTTLTRRDYLKTSALLGGSMFFPKLSLGKSKPSANSKLNVALIGSGGIAESAFGDCKNQNVIAIADVDDVQGAPGFKTFPDAKRYKDFRKLLDAHAKDLDLVIVNTPDHTHFAATYAAMEIRSKIPRASSNFNYAMPLSEIVILGTIANRCGKRVEYLPQSMTFRDASLNHYIKEPARKGWEYGEDLLKS